MSERAPISSARLCRDCSNLVTTDLFCPVCDKPTIDHPKHDCKEEYCQHCAEGPFPAAQLHLVTWNENPCMQFDYDGDEDDEIDFVAVCVGCRSEIDGEAEELFV